MKKIISLLMLLSALNAGAQKVETVVGEGWVEIPVQQTQSELKPGWKIVDYQMKSKLTRYLSGGHASQLVEKASKYYRKMFKPLLIECNYIRLEPSNFDIKAESDSFICQPKQPLMAGEYIIACLTQHPIGELQDLLVYPFSVGKE